MASQIRISPDQMRERANSYQTESQRDDRKIRFVTSVSFRRMGRIGKRGLQRTL